MWRHLLELYEDSKLNFGEPVCLFRKTLIFEEGWLLRSVLKEWKTSSRRSKFDFFQFPANARVYSEGQLFTPFKARFRGDDKAETNTHVDGIAGDFSIAKGTKSGIKLGTGCEYIAEFEAKLYSPIGKGTKRAKGYDQVSRITACLIHSLLQAGPRRNCKAYVVVLYPEDNLKIMPRDFEKPDIEARIADRLAEYRNAGDSTDELRQFDSEWRAMLDLVEVPFKTWEEVLAEIGDESLWKFYNMCKEFNHKDARRKHAPPSDRLPL